MGTRLETMLDLGILHRSQVKLVRQTEIAECGIAALAMITNFYGADFDIAALRRRFQPSMRGATLRSLIEIADRMGLASRPVKVSLEKLGNLHMPAILHWDMSHYVVLERVRNGKALIHNPEGVTLWLSFDEVSPHFTGVALELRPTTDFEPIGERARVRISQLWSRITGIKRALLQTALLSLVLEVFALASPYYLQLAVDTVVPSLDSRLLVTLAMGFAALAILNSATVLIRSFILLSAGMNVSYGIAINVARRLFRLPVDWFEKRHIGDVLSRFQSVRPIQQFLTQGAVVASIDGVLTSVTLLIMCFYSIALASIAIIGLISYALVRLLSLSAQRRAQEESIVAGGKEQSTMIESLRGIVTLRLFNKEAARHAGWQARLTDATNANIRLARIDAAQSAANDLVLGLEMVASVALAIRFVMAGGFSLGMVFAFLAYKAQFLKRSVSLIDQIIAFRILGLHLERLSDIALAEQDKSFTEEPSVSSVLNGRIELSNVSFRYSPNDPLVLRNINLVVEPGEHIAITGPSGCGKTTLIKVVLGLLEPTEGDVLVDNRSLRAFGYKNYHEQVSAVLQDDHLFTGSIEENVALFDETPDRTRVESAATAAALHEDILSMPMGYETLVGDMGSSLSGGQRQRLLLARAIYRTPAVLVLDEGTSHLDPEREKAVNESVAGLGVTRIVVAHRLETVLNATRIFSLDRQLLEVTNDFAALRNDVASARAKLSGRPASK